MAKRRKEKDEEEDKPFKLPKFDEEKYIKKEKKSIRATFVAVIFGGFIALICFAFWALMGSENSLRWPLVVLVAVANAAFIRYLYLRIKLDTSDFTNKNWFGSYALYFVAWLIVFIVLVNPPIYDDESPVIEPVCLPRLQEPGGDILIVAKITDNVGVNENSIECVITDPDDETITIKPESYDQNYFVAQFIYENPDNLNGKFSYEVVAADVNGQIKRTSEDNFEYDDDTIDLDSSEFENIDSNQDIKIDVDRRVSLENFRVFYTIDGVEINVDRQEISDPEEYETSPEFEGWKQNSNYSLNVIVETSHYFPNIPTKYSNLVVDSEKYNFSTSGDDDIGEEEPPMPWNWSLSEDQQAPVILNYDNPTVRGPVLPYPHGVRTPGFVTLIFIIAMVALVLIFKYKKKNKRNQK